MAHTHTATSLATRLDRALMLSLWGLPLLAVLALLLSAGAAMAQDDPPGRVGRIANLQGPVSWFDADEGRWTAADRNRPLTTGDRIATAAEGSAELRVGSSVLRLGPRTELEVLRLDDERMAWQLHSGSLAVRVKNRDTAQETQLVTGEVRLQPERAGHYRLDRTDDTTLAAVWRGALRVAEPGPDTVIEDGQRVELWRERAPGSARWSDAAAVLRQRSSRMADDEFAAWALAEDRSEDRFENGGTAHRYVSAEMTGAEELDRHGRWDQHPEHGAIWLPTATVADWAPYRHGRWAWVRPWGWTWVDDARWGFAPFHYGRWVNWRGRWGWCPGAYEARPVFAPALVAWVGGPRLGVSVSIGLPAVAWVPLAPRERYVPHHRHTPVYERRVNVHMPPHVQPPTRDGHAHHRPDHAHRPFVYTNQGVPGAVTVVPRDVLLQRQPVARAVVGPPAPRVQVPPTEPSPAPGEYRRRDPREAERRRGDPPFGADGPPRRVAPVAPVVPVAPAAPVASTAPLPAAAVAGPAPASVAAPAPVVPTVRAEKPSADRPGRPHPAEAEEGRKRGPGNPNRERENLR